VELNIILAILVALIGLMGTLIVVVVKKKTPAPQSYTTSVQCTYWC